MSNISIKTIFLCLIVAFVGQNATAMKRNRDDAPNDDQTIKRTKSDNGEDISVEEIVSAGQIVFSCPDLISNIVCYLDFAALRNLPRVNKATSTSVPNTIERLANAGESAHLECKFDPTSPEDDPGCACTVSLSSKVFPKFKNRNINQFNKHPLLMLVKSVRINGLDEQLESDWTDDEVLRIATFFSRNQALLKNLSFLSLNEIANLRSNSLCLLAGNKAITKLEIVYYYIKELKEKWDYCFFVCLSAFTNLHSLTLDCTEHYETCTDKEFMLLTTLENLQSLSLPHPFPLLTSESWSRFKHLSSVTFEYSDIGKESNDVVEKWVDALLTLKSLTKLALGDSQNAEQYGFLKKHINAIRHQYPSVEFKHTSKEFLE